MTLEQVINKMESFNAKLEDYITEIQSLPASYNLNNLRARAGAIERVILNDPAVKKILLEGTPEQRRAYTTAIESGIKRTTEIIEQYRTLETDGTRKKEIGDLGKNANKDVRGLVEGLRDLDKPTSEATLKDSERKIDLADKIDTARRGIATLEVFERVKDGLISTGRTGTVEEAIDEVEDIKVLCAEKCKKIADVSSYTSTSNSVYKFLEEYKELIGKGYDIYDPDVQDALQKLKKVSIDTDRIDGYDPTDSSPLNATEFMPKSPDEFKDDSIVKAWIQSLESKVKDSEKMKKMKMEPEFLESRIQKMKSEIVDKIRDSVVLEKIDPNSHEEIQKPGIVPSELKEYLESALKNLKAYEKVQGKDPADLKRYVQDAIKLHNSYATVATSPNIISLDGATFTTSVDMTKDTSLDTAYTEIENLSDDNPFKVKFNEKVTEEVESALAAVPVPQYGRVMNFLYKARKILTFGLVLTPKEKYEETYLKTKANKEEELIKNLIEENKEKRSKAKETVAVDKESYAKKAREKIWAKKGKIDKKDKGKILEDKDKKEPLTR